LGDTIPALKNPHIGSVIAILLTLFLVYFGFWQWIWVLFGGSNQLFASMALMLVTLWLVRERRAFAWSFIPGLFMYLTTVAALLWTSWIALDKGFIHRAPEMTAPFVVGNLISAIFGLYMAVSAVILFIDGMRAFSEARKAAAAPAASGD
jgi:carbon starvation protein